MSSGPSAVPVACVIHMCFLFIRPWPLVASTVPQMSVCSRYVASPCPVWLLPESVSVHAELALFVLPRVPSNFHSLLLTPAPLMSEGLTTTNLVFQNEVVPPEYPSLRYYPYPFSSCVFVCFL